MSQTLTKHEEAALIASAQQGDEAALERLIEAHRPFLESLVSRFPQRSSMDREDLYQEAVIGFMEAVFTFDSERGSERLVTKARWTSSKAVRSAVGLGMDIPVPASTLSKYLSAMTAAEDDYEAAQALAFEQDRMGKETFAAVHFALHGGESLDSATDEEGRSLHETVAGPSLIAPPSDRSPVLEALEELPSEGRFILRLAFGFETGEPMTDQEISEYLHAEYLVSMSRATVQRRRIEALEALREQGADLGGAS